MISHVASPAAPHAYLYICSNSQLIISFPVSFVLLSINKTTDPTIECNHKF